HRALDACRFRRLEHRECTETIDVHDGLAVAGPDVRHGRDVQHAVNAGHRQVHEFGRSDVADMPLDIGVTSATIETAHGVIMRQQFANDEATEQTGGAGDKKPAHAADSSGTKPSGTKARWLCRIAASGSLSMISRVQAPSKPTSFSAVATSANG